MNGRTVKAIRKYARQYKLDYKLMKKYAKGDKMFLDHIRNVINKI